MRVSDEPYTEIQVIDLPAQDYAVVQHRGVTMGDLSHLFGAAMGPLQAAMEAGSFRATGPFLAVYSGNVDDAFDLGIGFPAEHVAPQPDGEITSLSLPAARAAVISHLGSYSGLGDAWGRFTRDIRGRGLAPSSRFLEVYVSDPDVAEEHLRTDLVVLLED